MTALELANKTLLELINEHRDNLPLIDKLMIVYTALHTPSVTKIKN